MEISFPEAVILAVVRKGATSKRELAAAAVQVHASKRYSNTVALQDIQSLVNRGFLNKHRFEDLLEITRDGCEALDGSILVLREVIRISDNNRY